MSDKIQVTPDDMLAMLAFRSQQIISSCGARANGAPFPSPKGLRDLISEMLGIADRIVEILPAEQRDAT